MKGVKRLLRTFHSSKGGAILEKQAKGDLSHFNHQRYFYADRCRLCGQPGYYQHLYG